MILTSRYIAFEHYFINTDAGSYRVVQNNLSSLSTYLGPAGMPGQTAVSPPRRIQLFL